MDSLNEAAEIVYERLSLTPGAQIPLRFVAVPFGRDQGARTWVQSRYESAIEFPAADLPAQSATAVRAAALNLVTRHLVARWAGPDPAPWLVIGLAAELEQGSFPSSDWSSILNRVGLLPTQVPPRASGAVEDLSHAFVSHLVTTKGWPALGSVLKLRRDGHSLPTACLKGFNVPLDEIEQQWVALGGGID